MRLLAGAVIRAREGCGELLGDAAAGDRSGSAAGLAVRGVLRREAVQVGLAFDVAFDEVDAVVMIDGDVDDGNATVDALRVQCSLAGGDPVPGELDDPARGRHDAGSWLSVGRVRPAGA